MIPESEYGISGFVTKSDPIDGYFKESAESFVVDELSNTLPEVENGKYQILRVRLRNWETNKFVIYLARKLGISRKRITYAGTKDRTGITTQLFCVNSQNPVREISFEDVEVLDMFRSDTMLKLGDLQGNRFSIDLKLSGSDSRVQSVIDELNEYGGFPNFFGYQRFGSLRPITHRVGRLLVQNRYEDAVLEYLCDPEIDTDSFRIDLCNERNYRKALAEFPERLHYERAILQHIVEKKTLQNALMVLPKNLQIMFVHAYQSYIFNRILSMRMKEFPDFFSLQEGEMFAEIDELFNTQGETRSVNLMNREKVAALSRDDKVRILLPLVGTNSVLPGEQSDAINAVLSEEGVKPSDFRIPDHPELRSTGLYRTISAKPRRLLINEGKIEFELGRGIYASSLLREILKENMFKKRDS